MNSTSGIIILSYVLIASISVYGLAKDKLPFSLNKVFWIFCFLFLGLTPLLQFATNIHPFPWMNNQHDLYSFAYTNVVIILCMITFLLVNKWLLKKHVIRSEFKDEFSISDRAMNNYKIWGNLIFILAIVLQIVISGNLWYRRAAEENIIISNSSLQLFADKTLKGLVLYFCLLTVHLKRAHKISLLQLFTVLLLAAIANFPSAIPRYWFAALYLGVILTTYRAYFTRRIALFGLSLIGGIVLLFPLFNIARWKKQQIEYYSTSLNSALKGLAKLFQDSFCGQDFDAYASLRNTVLYVEHNGITWGKQLLTVFLFFVPRSVWPMKGIGSGALVNPPKPHSDFNNYSSPLFAEGYLNFGIPGAILLIGLFAFICTRYDVRFWTRSASPFARIFYPSFIGMSFFILRGDLLSSFAYTVGLIISGYCFHKLIFLKK